MSFDFSSLSTDTLLYFLTHSTAFVVLVASIFFTFGLGFGWLTWGRYKWQRRHLLSEAESMKDEIATLKRKLAEHAVRSASLSEPAPFAEPLPREAHAEPDPVIHSFLSAAAAILPQTSTVDEAPLKSASLPIEPEEVGEEQPVESQDTDEAPEEVPVAVGSTTASEEWHPEDDPTPPDTQPHRLHVRDLIDRPGGDRDLSQISPSPPPEPSESAEPIVQVNQARPSVEPSAAEPASQESDNRSPAPLNGDSRLTRDPHLGLLYASRPGLSDDLSHLKGVASIIEGRLNDFGVYTFKQIALWNEENIREFSQRLSFKDRIRREQWVEQARELHYQKYGERV